MPETIMIVPPQLLGHLRKPGSPRDWRKVTGNAKHPGRTLQPCKHVAKLVDAPEQCLLQMERMRRESMTGHASSMRGEPCTPGCYGEYPLSDMGMVPPEYHRTQNEQSGRARTPWRKHIDGTR